MNTEQSSPGSPGRSGGDPWIGSVIDGRYRIEDRLARGGMSTVYLGRDERLGRQVALKVLFPHMAEDRKVVERFEQEARNSALISHANVVQVLDQGQTRETAYLVMEYVPGATLRTLLKRGPMTPRLALTYMDAILQGLAAAHRAGLVHRDIKPENVLVSRDGRIKLADFGLARAATHHSGTSTLMGTVAYISPELLSGDGADERADIYAIGILLYEVLTGTQPYTGDSPVRIAFQHVNSTVPAPSATVEGLAAPLDDLVRTATQSDATQRPKNADALLNLIRSTREILSPEQLDFDGARTSQRVEPQEPVTVGTAVMPTPPPENAEPPDEGSPEAPSEEPSTDQAEPVDTEDPAWDEDVDVALEHARTTTLDEAERQTVAEVPTEVFRAEADDATTVFEGNDAGPSEETSEFSAVGTADPRPAAPRESPSAGSSKWRRAIPGSSSKERQRPRVQLEAPSPTRTWVTIAVIIITSGLIVLFGWYLGLSPEVIPSLGSGETTPPE